jgi:hypothetical protein
VLLLQKRRAVRARLARRSLSSRDAKSSLCGRLCRASDGRKDAALVCVANVASILLRWRRGVVPYLLLLLLLQECLASMVALVIVHMGIIEASLNTGRAGALLVAALPLMLMRMIVEGAALERAVRIFVHLCASDVALLVDPRMLLVAFFALIRTVIPILSLLGVLHHLVPFITLALALALAFAALVFCA